MSQVAHMQLPERNPLSVAWSDSENITPSLVDPKVTLRTFAPIVYAHPYCARNSCRNAMLRHAQARKRKKSIHMKGW